MVFLYFLVFLHDGNCLLLSDHCSLPILMAYSAEESSPLTQVSDPCCICSEIFSSDSELTHHLLDHANEEKFKTLLSELEAQNGKRNQTVIPMRTKRHSGPEFIRTSFVREPPLRKKVEVPAAPPEPEVWEIVSDDEEPDKDPNPKKAKLSSSFRLVSSGNTPNNANNTTNNNTSSEKGPPFNCHSCTSVFNDAVAFREHLATHEKPRPFVCHICKKSFAYKGTLRQHLHLHISERSHECRVCHKKFSIKSVLRKHEETHELQHHQEPQKNNS